MIDLPCGHRISEGREPAHYCEILHLNTLLHLQPQGKESLHPDHHLFILIHQVSELWFKQILVELRGLIVSLDEGDVGRSIWLAQRLSRIASLLVSTVTIMESISPTDFLVFRDHYGSTSGGDSIQFREIELLAGNRDPAYRRFLETPMGNEVEGTILRWTKRLRDCWEGRSVDQAFDDLLQRRGLSVADLYAVAPARNPNFDLMSLVEALLDFDESFARWRGAHARVAERAIGPTVRGTGYTVGVRYLDATVNRRFFARLWESRTAILERRASAMTR